MHVLLVYMAVMSGLPRRSRCSGVASARSKAAAAQAPACFWVQNVSKAHQGGDNGTQGLLAQPATVISLGGHEAVDCRAAYCAMVANTHTDSHNPGAHTCLQVSHIPGNYQCITGVHSGSIIRCV